MSCPCGRNKSYQDCCGLIHQDIKMAKTAEDLMRSRYTAFTMAMGDYLIESHHKSTRKPNEKKAIVKWAKSVKWLKLEVLRTENGSENDNEGIVEFKAVFLEGLRPNAIEETSRFLKEDGVWCYLDAI